MAGPNSKRPAHTFPKAGALKTQNANSNSSRGPAFKENPSSYDASAALKLRDPIPAEKSENESQGSLFESLYAPKTNNKLALVDPDDKTTRIADLKSPRDSQSSEQTSSKTERDPLQSDETTALRPSLKEGSVKKTTIEPTLSPSAIGKLKNRHQQQKSQNLAVTEVSDPKRKKSRSQAKSLRPGESIHDAETRVTRISQTSAQERATLWDSRTGVTIRREIESANAESEEKMSLAPFLLIGIIAMGIIYLFMTPSSHSTGASRQSKFSSDEEKALVQMHRFETGSELNSGRTAVEFKNMQTAPSLSSSASRVKTGSMMDGLPLQQEVGLRTTARDRLEAANPNDPDHRVQYILQDEQQAQQWEQQAQKEYMREFVKNVQDAGYQVRIHDNLDIDIRRAPGSARNGGQAGDGAGSSNRGARGIPTGAR